MKGNHVRIFNEWVRIRGERVFGYAIIREYPHFILVAYIDNQMFSSIADENGTFPFVQDELGNKLRTRKFFERG